MTRAWFGWMDGIRYGLSMRGDDTSDGQPGLMGPLPASDSNTLRLSPYIIITSWEDKTTFAQKLTRNAFKILLLATFELGVFCDDAGLAYIGNVAQPLGNDLCRLRMGWGGGR